jgi:hypothetical protein
LIYKLPSFLEKKLLRLFLMVSILVNYYNSGMATPGQNALEFLNLPTGAYSAALGNGNYAGIIGPEAIFLNPSQIGQRTGAFACHQELLLDTHTEAFAAAIKLADDITVAGGAYFFDPGDIEGYSNDNERIGNIGAGDRLLRLAGLTKQGDFSFGVSISQYNQRLDNLVGNGWGLGAGVSLETGVGRLALSADNIGPDFRIGVGSSPLPARLALSALAPLCNNMLNLNLDFISRRGLGQSMAVGLEYKAFRGLSLRAGSARFDPISLGFRISNARLSLDYSYIPQSEFGDRHIFSVSFLK